VTGSLDAPDEPLEAAAARELREETGIDAASGRLRRWQVAYTFEIYQRWRHRFAPGVTHNTEHLFSFELAERAPVALAPLEHTALAWLPWRAAAQKCFSWSNRDAISLIGAALLAAGCASTEAPVVAPLAPHLESGPAEVRECAQWYRALDAEIDAAGVRDAQYARVAGFPHLRVDRLLASLRDRVGESRSALRTYTERLHELDLESRRHEVQNLRALPGEAARTQALRRARDCGRVLLAADLASSEAHAALLAAARVPVDRPATQGSLEGVRRWEAQTLADFQREPEPAPTSVRYAPPPARGVPRDAVAGLLGRATFDPFGQLGLTAREVDRLAATYAPSFEIEIAGDYDRFGWLRWLRGFRVPQVDAAEPAVYVHSAYTRYRGQLLLQLVYTIWFAERPPRGAVDSLAGRLDGLVWRVTLAPDGEPLVYDSIHPSGSFHLFFPTPRATPQPAPDAHQQWAFAPQSLPRLGEGERPVVMIASGTHAIRRVRVVRGPDSLVRYALRPYDELRSMPRMVGNHASAFGPDGRIAGSKARQWGRLSGDFEDTNLLERRFALDP
ncbi:MAG: dihydroneopterin triphosphate diphosphatase, partial [Panacagrimonas sp.]